MKIQIADMHEHIALIERLARWDGRPYVVDVQLSDGRTTDQNRLLWACLRDVSKQVEWFGEYLPPESWKDIFTAAQKKERVRYVPGLEGGVVMTGAHTSKMSKAELTELIDLIYAFGADKDVDFTETGERDV